MGYGYPQTLGAGLVPSPQSFSRAIPQQPTVGYQAGMTMTGYPEDMQAAQPRVIPGHYFYDSTSNIPAQFQYPGDASGQGQKPPKQRGHNTTGFIDILT
jgi:hypothetical protein